MKRTLAAIALINRVLVTSCPNHQRGGRSAGIYPTAANEEEACLIPAE